MRSRGEVLEFAILGLLHDTPMHGYELRKDLNGVLGSFRALSYGSLYPCLRRMEAAGWIAGSSGKSTPPPHALSGRRARIVYQLTAEGKEHFHALAAEAGPTSWEDESFDVRFAFFARTDSQTRLRILEGRRTRLTERLDGVRQSMARARERMDEYTLELQRHGLEQVEREVKWLDGLIDNERGRHLGVSTPGDRTSDRPTAGEVLANESDTGPSAESPLTEREKDRG